MDVSSVISQLTLDEKIGLVAGINFMYTKGVPRLGVPALRMSDGPHGLRIQRDGGDNGVTDSEPATSFPTAVTVASSWNPENARRVGVAIGEECHAYGVHMVLGPGVNIKRNPLCGRNFEYFSEDPLVAGQMGAAEVEGIQSQGVGSCVKHFALNNGENFRFMGNSVADARTMREVYLRPFERIVKQAQPAAMMSAYNRINGTYCSQNGWLLDETLRKEWGFEGLVMTDWGGMHDRVAALQAGLDLEMPGDTAICCKWIAEGIASGQLKMADLNAAVENVLEMVNALVEEGESAAEVPLEAIDVAGHHALAAEVAADSAVLLQNYGALPLVPGGRYVVVGDLFEKMRYQGSGSSMINPAALTTPRDAFDARGVNYTFARGYTENTVKVQRDLIDQAVELAKCEDCNAVLVFAGLTDWVESEGCDRESMALPANQLALIDALSAAGKPVVVVLFGGSAMEVPFTNKVNAILYMALPGQAGGEACAQLLLGDVCPSGRLAETWPLCYEDVPDHALFGTRKQELYKEGLQVGYRGYATRDQSVRYPFGFGLSYTEFSWSDMETAASDRGVTVSCTVENAGTRAGASTVQLYVAAPQTAVEKPAHELRAFRKVYLQPGEKQRVTLNVPLDDLRFYNPDTQGWMLEAGDYDFRLCANSATIIMRQTITLQGETVTAPVRASHENLSDAEYAALCGCPDAMDPQPRNIDVESRFDELRDRSFMGRILFNAVLSVGTAMEKKASKMPDGPERDNRLKGAFFMKKILESNSLISMSMCAGGQFPYNFAQGFANLANGHLLRGALCFLKPIRVVLPDEKPSGSSNKQ